MQALQPAVKWFSPAIIPGGGTSRKLTIFISHASQYPTDHKSHGDGLVAYAIIKHLAQDGHVIHAAVALSAITCPLPSNVTWHKIPTRASQSDDHQSLIFRLEYALGVRKLWKHLQKQVAFDVIHQLNPVVLGLSSLLFGKSIPLVVGPCIAPWNTNSPEALSYKARIRTATRSLAQRILLSNCQAFLVPNEISASYLESAGFSEKLIFRLPYGIDDGVFQPAPDTVAKIPTVLYLAGLWKRKGIYPLLDAWAIVNAAIPSARLLIAGEGEEEFSMRMHVAALQNPESVKILGRVERDRVSTLMQHSSVYCLPSFGEPFGMSALEAMACGRPLVVTDAGGLSELVPGEGGIKVPVGDSRALAGALLKLLQNPVLAEAMGARNRRHVVSHYSWEVVIKKLVGFYWNIANKGLDQVSS